VSEDSQPDWAPEIAKASEALRLMAPIIQAQEAQRLFAPIIQAQEALRRQIEPIIQAQEALRRQIEPIATALEQFARIANWSKINGGVALSPTVFVSDRDVITLSETASVEEFDSRRRVLAGLSDGQILTLVLIWLIVLVIPAAAWDANLPTEIQALVDVYDGVLANVAVAITFDILGKRKKR
jgi:hypothetical protein